MTTALANTSAPFAGLTPGSRQMAIIAANLEGEGISEMDLTKVRTPAGGGTTWEIDNQGNTETSQEIVGILVAIGKRGLLWPYDEIGEEPPVIVTNDLVTGYRVSDKLGGIDATALDQYRIGDRRYDWAALSEGPEFGPKSGKGGVGKRVKESRTLAILRDGDVWPVLISIGPGSLGTFMPFLKKLPCFHYEAVIGLKLQKEKSKSGVTYSMIVPRLAGQLTEEQGEFVRKMYTEPMKKTFGALPNGAVAAASATVDAE
jgi:hypothetical protein